MTKHLTSKVYYFFLIATIYVVIFLSFQHTMFKFFSIFYWNRACIDDSLVMQAESARDINISEGYLLCLQWCFNCRLCSLL